MTNDLVPFINARLDEDEAKARRWPMVLEPLQAGQKAWFDTAGHVVYEPGPRLIWEVAAKRQIVQVHRQDPNKGGDCDACYSDRWPCQTLRLVALPYLSHPDYQAADFAPHEREGRPGEWTP